MKILVIDDDEQMRVLLRQVMEWAGHEVVEAADGRAGMLMQRQHGADLVITDLIMPEQEGLETITALRRDYPGLKIIAYLPAARELGADRVFSKPFDVQELAETVRELLAHG